MFLKLIDSRHAIDGNTIEIELPVIDEKYTFEYNAQYNGITNAFKDNLKNIVGLSKMTKLLTSVQNIKTKLYSIFNNISNINYSQVGILSSKYFDSVKMNPLSFKFVIQNKSVDCAESLRDTYEKEFLQTYNQLIFLSTFKITKEGVSIDEKIRDYENKNINVLLKGADFDTLLYKSFQSTLGEAGLNLSSIKQTGATPDNKTTDGTNTDLSPEQIRDNNISMISSKFNEMSEMFKNNDIRDVAFKTPEQVFLQLYEKDNFGKKHFIINSLNENFKEQFENNINNAPNVSYDELLQKSGAYLFLIKTVDLDFNNCTFIKHKNNKIYPTILKGTIILENSRSLTLNEAETFLTNSHNLSVMYK